MTKEQQRLVNFLEEDLQQLEKHTEKVNTLCCQYINNSFDYHKDIEAIESFISYWTRHINKLKTN
tara:strand:+ start:3258 stop:3452 length:195 start_codon:yes stop_codon:yes gene_type:complete